MGHYHSYEAEAKGLGTSVLDFTEEEWKVNIKKPPHPGNISLRGNNDDMAKQHLHDYSLAFSEVYAKRDTNVNRTINSIKTNLHDQKSELVQHPAKVVKNEARDINQAVQFAEDIHYLRFEANNTANVNNNPMIVFNIPPIHEQLFLERQRGQGMTFSDRYSRFLGEFEMTLDTFEHAQKKIKFHEISENPKFKGDAKLLYSRLAEEKSFQASKNKSDSRLEMSQRDHPLNASMFSDKKQKTQLSSENSHEKPVNQSQASYSRDQTKYHTFKADNNNYEMHSPQRNEESQSLNQKYLNESPQNPFYDHNTSYSKKSPEKVEERQITPRSSANKKVQVGSSLNQSQSQSQIRQSQTKTPPMTNQKVLNQSKRIESSGSAHKSSKAVATTPQKHIPIVPSTSKNEIQNMQFQTPDSRTKTPPPRRSSPSPNTISKKTGKRSVSPNQQASGQKDSRIKYKAFWREAERPRVVKKDTKRVPLKHENAKIKEGFEILSKTMKPSKVLGVNEKYVPLEKKKPPEQLFDKSHDYELVYVRPSVQKNHSPESNNEQPQSQRNSEKKQKIQKATLAENGYQDSQKKNKQTHKNQDYDEEQDYEEQVEEEEQDDREYQNQDQEEEDFDEEYEREQEDRSLVEDEYMTERYERDQRRKNGDYSSNYDNKAEYVETSIDISSYLNNNNQKKMPRFNQQGNYDRGNMYNDNDGNDDQGGDTYYDNDQQQPEYYEREYELPSSQNDFGEQRQQMQYAPKIRNKYNQERYEEDQDFDDQNYLHDILDRVRNLHDKMENSFSDITRDHSRIAEEDEDRPEEQKYSQFKQDGTRRYKSQQDERDPFYPARQDRYEQNEPVQNFPGSSKLKVSSKKLRAQGER